MGMASTTMRAPAANAPVSRLKTFVGLAVALFGIVAVRELVHAVVPNPAGVTGVTLREALIYALAAGLLLYVRFVEGRSLRTLGFGAAPLWRSLARGLVLAVVCLAAAVALVALTRYDGGAAGKAFGALPLWLITLTVIRAGVVEELFYRGYAIERLEALGCPAWVAALAPLLLFAVFHWRGGVANILIAFVLGGILAAYFVWKRDLTANIFAHFLVDFVGNVLPKLAGQ